MESGGGGSNDGNKAPAAPEAQRTSSTTTAAATGGSAASAADGQAASAAAAPDPVSIADGAGRLTGLTHLYYTRPGQARLREEGEEYLQQHPEVYRIMDYYTARGACVRGLARSCVRARDVGKAVSPSICACQY